MSKPSMKSIREAVSRQLGTDQPQTAEFDPASLVRFSPELPEQLPSAERERLQAEADELQPLAAGTVLPRWGPRRRRDVAH